MKKRYWILIALLLATTVLTACVGAYLKFQVLRPLELFQEESILKVPFLLMADDGARYMLANQHELEETDPPTEEPGETDPSVTLPPETTPVTVPETTPKTVPETTPETVPETTPETVPPTEPVVIDETWFDDALFIGDSRTVGMRDFARLGEADYFCDVGMTVFKVTNYTLHIKGIGRTKLAKALEKKEYGKVFIHLGLNECSSKRELIMKKYREIVDLIQEKRPDAEIYIQAAMVVTEFKSHDPRFTMENIMGLNDELKALAEEEEIQFIDTNAWAGDENGFLRDDIRAGDGIHLCADGYRAWSTSILEQIQEMYG